MKVQSFRNLTRYIDKSEDFLLRNEVSNNLFWEVFNKLKKIPENHHWAANVMDDREIILSVMKRSVIYKLGVESNWNSFKICSILFKNL